MWHQIICGRTGFSYLCFLCFQFSSQLIYFGKQQKMAQVPRPLATQRKSGWRFRSVSSTWPYPGRFSHLESDPVNGFVFLSLSLLLCVYVYFCFANKWNIFLNEHLSKAGKPFQLHFIFFYKMINTTQAVLRERRKLAHCWWTKGRFSPGFFICCSVLH